MGSRPRRVVKGIPKQLPPIGRTDTLTVGAQKALKAMRVQYGGSEGNRIYLQKAEEQGRGRTLRQKVNSIYHTGAKIGS